MVPEVKLELTLFIVTNLSREYEADPAAPTGPHHPITVFHQFLQNQSACFGYLAKTYFILCHNSIISGWFYGRGSSAGAAGT